MDVLLARADVVVEEPGARARAVHLVKLDFGGKARKALGVQVMSDLSTSKGWKIEV